MKLRWTLKVLGREFDLVEAVILVSIELVLFYLGSKIIASVIASDAAKAVVLIVLALLIAGAPICYLYGPPWSSKQPQKLVQFNLGGSQSAGPLPPPVAPSVQEPEPEKKPTIPELEARLRIERANAYRWEYAYLNYQLVLRTQAVLDWLYRQKDQPPPALPWFRTYFSGVSTNEQDAMLDVLEQHYLILYVGECIQLTPKGCEYVEWRGLDSVPRWIAAMAERKAAQQQAAAAAESVTPPDQATSSE